MVRAPRRDGDDEATRGLSVLGRLGLAGQTAFFAALAGLTVRIAALGGGSGHQADPHGALALVSRPVIGKVAIGVVALGFLLFGVARILGAVRDRGASTGRRVATGLQGVFFALAVWVPASYLGGDGRAGSQQQQQRTTAELLHLPGGRGVVVALGLVVLVVCVLQIRVALQHDFRDGLELAAAPRLVRRVVDVAGVVGIIARSVVFLPVGAFLIVSAVRADPGQSYGTDAEMLQLSGHPWGVAVLALVAAGLATFVVYSALETRYRQVVSAR